MFRSKSHLLENTEKTFGSLFSNFHSPSLLSLAPSDAEALFCAKGLKMVFSRVTCCWPVFSPSAAAAAGSMSQSLATNQRKGRITRRRFVNAEANEQAESYNSFGSCHPFHHESTSPVVPRWDCGKAPLEFNRKNNVSKPRRLTVDKSARSSTQTVGTLFLLRS